MNSLINLLIIYAAISTSFLIMVINSYYRLNNELKREQEHSSDLRVTILSYLRGRAK